MLHRYKSSCRSGGSSSKRFTTGAWGLQSLIWAEMLYVQLDILVAVVRRKLLICVFWFRALEEGLMLSGLAAPRNSLRLQDKECNEQMLSSTWAGGQIGKCMLLV